VYEERTIDAGRVLWRSTGGAAAVIPADGCLDLILHGDQVHVAGPSTVWIPTRADGDTPTIGVRIAPGAARGLLNTDLSALRDRFVPLIDVVARARAVELADGLRRLANPVDGYGSGLEVAPAGWPMLVRLRARRGDPASAVQAELGWSARRFRRAMSGGFGYGYASLVRIERARRARELLTRGSGLAATAALAGYADQPHLTREFGRLVGVTPGQFAGSAANRSIELPSGSSTVA
jgi:AraC-like DNA-binding protein